MKEMTMNMRQIKRTIGRSIVSLSSLIAPTLVARYAVTAFSRPRGLPGLDPVVEGWPARRFPIDTDAGTLTAWEWGEGPTVLLVHGWGGRAEQMMSFVPPLLTRGFHVLAIDLPAHGLSSGDHTNVVDVARVITQVVRKFQPVHGLIAHSVGASASGLALAKGLGIERAVLIAPAAELTPFARAFASQLGVPRRNIQRMLERLDHEIEGGLGATDLRRMSPGSATRVLVVHDPEDRRVPFTHGQQLAEAWPGAELCVVRGVGHDGALRDPAIVEHVVTYVADRPQPVRRAS
jgi:pimeloyl-ACP methyl ester carboxylesterase